MDYLSFSDIKTKIISFFRANIGENINLSDSETGGQIVNLGADACSDVSDLTIDAYNANTILSEGQDLDVQAVRMGTTRIQATYATIYNFLVECSDSCELTTDAVFQDSNSVQFSPIEDYTLEAGNNRIAIQAVNSGSIEITEGDVDTVVSGAPSEVDSVENDSSSIFQDGVDDETDEELRTRLQSVSSSVTYTENAIKKAIEELDYVTNATIVSDDINGTVEAIVEQSDLSDSAKLEVCQKILYSKAGGILAKANGSNTVERTIGNNVIQYTLPTLKNIYVRLTLGPELTAEQKNSLTEYLYNWSLDFEAGEDLVIYGTDSLLIACVEWSGTDFASVQIEVSEDNTTWSSGNIETSDYEIIRISDVSYL